MPLVINTHDRKSCCRYHNTTKFWREHVLVNYVKRVTLWRPRCFMDTRLADLVLPERLPNLTELTLSGNFTRRLPSPPGFRSQDFWLHCNSLKSKNFPLLKSIRLQDVDNAAAICILLRDVAPQVKLMEIQPTSIAMDPYDDSSLALYKTLCPLFQHLKTLEKLRIALQPSCNGSVACHDAQLLIKMIKRLPNKSQLRALTIQLPQFNCTFPVEDSDSTSDEDASELGLGSQALGSGNRHVGSADPGRCRAIRGGGSAVALSSISTNRGPDSGVSPAVSGAACAYSRAIAV